MLHEEERVWCGTHDAEDPGEAQCHLYKSSCWRKRTWKNTEKIWHYRIVSQAISIRIPSETVSLISLPWAICWSINNDKERVISHHRTHRNPAHPPFPKDKLYNIVERGIKYNFLTNNNWFVFTRRFFSDGTVLTLFFTFFFFMFLYEWCVFLPILFGGVTNIKKFIYLISIPLYCANVWWELHERWVWDC